MHCLCGSAIVAVLAAGAPVEPDHTVLARAGPVGVLRERRGATVARPEEPEGPKGEVEDARHSVKIASLVVEARAERFMLPSPRAEFTVGAALKGSVKGDRVVVDLRRAPFGRWPRKGDKHILCLASRDEGDYELASYHACVLPATGPFHSAIVEWIGTQDPAEAPDPLMEAVAASDTVVVGALTGLSPRERGRGASGTLKMFKIEDALLGYADFPNPILVSFPASSDEVAFPTAGRYVLFLKGGGTGEAFTVVDATPLAGDRHRETMVKRVRAALGPRKARLTTVQATLAEYERSWNEREIGRLMECYSRGSRLRRQYDRDPDARKMLASQLNAFSGELELALLRVEPHDSPPAVVRPGGSRRAAGPSEASAEVEIAISGDGFRDRLPIVMKLTKEDGEWLLIDDGF